MLKKITIEMLVDTTADDLELSALLRETLDISRKENDADDIGTREANVITVTIEDCNKPITPFKR